MRAFPNFCISQLPKTSQPVRGIQWGQGEEGVLGKGCCHHTCTDCPNLPCPQREAHCFDQMYLELLQKLANPIITRLFQNTSTQSQQHCSSAGLLSSQDPSSNPLPRPATSLGVERRRCFVPFPLLPEPQSFPSLLHWLLNAKDSFLSQGRWWWRGEGPVFLQLPWKVSECQTAMLSIPS